MLKMRKVALISPHCKPCSNLTVKTAVQKEIKWFAAPYDIPATVHQPPASSIEQFKDLLYSVRYDKVISPYGMSPNELKNNLPKLVAFL